MSPTAASLEGVERFRDTLQDAARELVDMTDAGTAAGRVLADELAQQAPRRTGYLASNMATVATAELVTVTATADYSAAVNALDPFKARALDASIPRIIDIYADAAAAAMAQVKGV